MGPCGQGRNKTQKVKKRKKAAELWKEPRDEQGLTLMVKHTEATVCLSTHFNKAQGRNLDSHLYPVASKI